MFFASALRQAWPAAPKFTEKDIPDLTGKVYLVTGANSGVGKLVAGTLYARGATVWVGARSQDRAEAAMAEMRAEAEAASSSSSSSSSSITGGRLIFLRLDLADLASVREAARRFLRENEGEGEGGRLDVLFNNAGVMIPPSGSATAQGHELQLGVNCLGHFLLTKLLTPVLARTAAAAAVAGGGVEEAAAAPPGKGAGGDISSKSSSRNGRSVRVVWVSSSAAELLTCGDGVPFDNLDYHRFQPYPLKYGTSKVGDYYYATEYARRHEKDGIVSVSLNPGNIRTELDRHTNFVEYAGRLATTWPAINGAYTELYAGLSADVTIEEFARSGKWVIPWGIISDIKSSVRAASKPESEGGTGVAQRFWEWSEEQVKDYV